MKEEDAVKVFDLAVKGKSLPAKMEDLVPLSFIGAAAVKFYQTKVKLMDQLGMTEAQRKATLRDGQDAGEMLLSIEARIGELLESRPRGKFSDPNKNSGHGVKLPDGVSNDRSHQAQAIHRNPAAVAAVIKEARENEDIPTKTAVLKHIQLERMREIQKDRVPENQRVKTLLGEEEFAEWAAWAQIRTQVAKRIRLCELSAQARREVQKVVNGITDDIAQKSAMFAVVEGGGR